MFLDLVNYRHVCALTHITLLLFVLSHVLSLQTRGLQPARLLCPWYLTGKNTRVGCHIPPPGDLSDPGIGATSLALSALAGRLFTIGPSGKPPHKSIG